MYPLRTRAEEIMARRGINPSDVPDDPGFDPAAYLVEQAQAALAAGLDARFVTAQPGNPTVISWTQTYLASPRTAPNLLLLGPTGTGKTTEAVGALRTVVLALAGRGQTLRWRAVNHPTLNAETRPQPEDGHLAAYERYATADLLLVDDLGAGKASDWGGDVLYRIVDYRWANHLPTIGATNLPPAGLSDVVGDRVVSRLADGVRVTLTGADRRLNPGGRP